MRDRIRESHKGSLQGIASPDPYERTNETDGESAYEGANLSVGDARTSKAPRSLAYATPCRYCGGEIYLAMCRDGKWRSFDTATVPPADSGVWAWRKTWGMEEQELVHGKRLHYCSHRNRPNVAPWDRGRP